MGLEKPVEFKARIQKGNRIQVPVKVRWAHKLEPEEPWQVEIDVKYPRMELYMGGERRTTYPQKEKFYATMSKNGRITIPQRIVREFPQQGKDLPGSSVEVTLHPV